ncbi:MAG: Asp-tRNA(Asn)/Glu-tRNA(Gln) amidotransferase subunit GatC [Spirochaetes bacterium]|nr:Asp-tRNA(Asn)/Glu-tRNA(Gln) amidotransferase subunit GatC [Spirochaetota bacterium]MBL7006117.1 Asp-tRNA(Asn)/Glu-tRNA(Gln) amidotransferase subunit GatC [Spirochaetia bacterium]
MDIEELRTTASLAMVELHDDEVERLSESVTDMLNYFSVMQKVDITGLEPTTHALAEFSTVREDSAVINPVPSENLVARAPENDGNHIIIPNVL